MMSAKNTGFDRIADKFVELFLCKDGDRVVKAAVVAYMEGVERGMALKSDPPAA